MNTPVVTYRRVLSRLGCALLFAGVVVGAGRATASNLTLVGVNTGQEDVKADGFLAEYLHTRLRTDIQATNEDYETAIKLLRENGDSPMLMRATPYVYVAAKLLGARIGIIGTYQLFDRQAVQGSAQSNTDTSDERNTTYHSYLILNRQSVDQALGINKLPSLSEVAAYVAKAKPVFIFHNQYSTSGYFLPAAWLRTNHLYTPSELQPSADDSLTAEKVKQSDLELINRIAKPAEGASAEFGATWDGVLRTIPKATADLIYIVELPQALPNDLLIYTSGVDKELVQRIEAAVHDMPAHYIADKQKQQGNISTWLTMGDAPSAGEALQTLTQAAARPTRPAVIMLGKDANVPRAALEAVQRAIKRSAAEFEEFEVGYHKRYDYSWYLTLAPDQSVSLRSVLRTAAVDSSGDIIQTEQFPFEPRDPEALTRRIHNWMASELAVIRYVWRYDEQTMLVLRDFDYPVENMTRIAAQAITWSNIAQNDFTPSKSLFDYDIDHDRSSADFIRLKAPATSAAVFDPLSRDAVRVFIRRPPRTSRFLAGVSWTGAGLLLFVGAAAFGETVRRSRRGAKPRQSVQGPQDSASYTVWSLRQLPRADVIWCDRKELEAAIADTENSGIVLSFNSVQRKTLETSIDSGGNNLLRWLPIRALWRRTVESTVSPKDVSDEKRLQEFLNEVTKRKLIAPFTGRPTISEDMQSIVSSYMMFPSEAREDRLREFDEFEVAREHVRRTLSAFDFYAGLARSLTNKLSLFRVTWMVTVEGDACVFRSPIEWEELRWSTARPRPVTLQFSLPLSVRERAEPASSVSLWMLGSIDDIVPAETAVTIKYKCIAAVR